MKIILLIIAIMAFSANLPAPLFPIYQSHFNFNNFDIISKIINIIAVIALCLLVLYYVLFFIGYLVEKNKIHVGNLEVDNEGIKDFSESGTIIGFSWDNIKAVVINLVITGFLGTGGKGEGTGSA